MLSACNAQTWDTSRGDWKTNLSLALLSAKGEGGELEVSEVPSFRHGSLFTLGLTKLVKVKPSLCWLQELVHFSDVTQWSNLQLLPMLKRSAAVWPSGKAQLFGRHDAQVVCVSWWTTVFSAAIWEMCTCAWTGKTYLICLLFWH